MLIFMISMFLLSSKQEISVHQLMLPVFTTHFRGLAWFNIVQLIQLQAISLNITNNDFIHSHRLQKTFNQHQCGDSCYAPVKNIIQIKSAPTKVTGRACKVNDEDYKKRLLHLPNFSNNKLLYIFILLLPFAKCFISVNKCLIRKTKTWQYSYF